MIGLFGFSSEEYFRNAQSAQVVRPMAIIVMNPGIWFVCCLVLTHQLPAVALHLKFSCIQSPKITFVQKIPVVVLYCRSMRAVREVKVYRLESVGYCVYSFCFVHMKDMLGNC